MILGTLGLDVQIQAMTQLFMNIIEFGMNPQEAIEAPRFASYSFPLTNIINNYEPGVLRCENDIKENVIENLSNLGHKIELWDLAGGLCAIQINNELKTLTAGADPRRDAYAIGR